MKIAILDDHQDQVRQLGCFALLREHEVTVFNHSAFGLGQLAVRLARFDAIVLTGTGTVLSASLLRKLPTLKYVVQIGPPGPYLDAAAAHACGIQVRAGGSDPTGPAELTWALIMAASRQIVGYAENLRDGVWQMASATPHYNRLGRRLKDQVLGIWGYGQIGKLVAGYGKAFGMRVLIWGSPTSCAVARADGYDIASSQQSLFEQADILTLHLRLGETNRGVVTAADLALMQPNTLLVNTSDAALIVPGALEHALQAGRPGAAALDLPVSALQASLLARPNVLATPRIGAIHYEQAFRAAFEDLLACAGASIPAA